MMRGENIAKIGIARDATARARAAAIGSKRVMEVKIEPLYRRKGDLCPNRGRCCVVIALLQKS